MVIGWVDVSSSGLFTVMRRGFKYEMRITGDQSLESISVMTRIERIALEASGLPEDKVAAAWDFMLLPVPMN